MIYVGIDDTDTLGSRGTNQLAKALVAGVKGIFRCQRIVRHQLLVDPRVPYTSKNGSASLVFEAEPGAVSGADLDQFQDRLIAMMRDDFTPGSDPGICLATKVAAPVVEYAKQCQHALMSQATARQVARENNLRLVGLGGTEDGVIGALAAVGLAAANDGGRVVHWKHGVDDLTACRPVSEILRRDIEVRELYSSQPVCDGQVDLGKRLRPNWSHGKCVLFVEQIKPGDYAADAPEWKALKLL